jgi:hypothetical protein
MTFSVAVVVPTLLAYLLALGLVTFQNFIQNEVLLIDDYAMNINR